MLELRNVKKTYKIGEIETRALNGISVAFREREFVAILGVSGSGKTTCLNIIGGLDRYDEGEMVIKGKNTTGFKDADWDAYRNNSVGFVFQSYNLINHLSIVANVELGMTLSGVSKTEKRSRAIEVLTEVGLKDHLHKNPNQLSGGQMQRVAIARALANDPEILLCDEPTGALDSATSEQIMHLIKSVAANRLVIMVTHNQEIADAYADRIIKFADGQIVSDTNPHTESDKPDMFSLKKTAMKFATALNLSGNNIRTKKGRTFLTAFASSIGIIGIAVILSLSNGFQIQIDKFQEDALSEFPVFITNSTADVDYEELQSRRQERESESAEEEKDPPPPTAVLVYDPAEFIIEHKNEFTEEYIDYIEAINPDICSSIGYTRLVNMNVLRKDGNEIKPIIFPTPLSMMTSMSGTDESMMGSGMMSMRDAGMSSYPKTIGDGESYLERNYELLYGDYPTETTDLVMLIGGNGRVSISVLAGLGFDIDRDTISFDEIIGTELKLIGNNEFYTERTEYIKKPVETGDAENGVDLGLFLPPGFDLNAMLPYIEDGTPLVGLIQGVAAQNPDVGFDMSILPEELLNAAVYKSEQGLEVRSVDGSALYTVVQENGSITAYGSAADNSAEEDEEQGEPVTYLVENESYSEVWDSQNNVKLKIVGIVRLSEDASMGMLGSGLVYSDELCDLVIDRALESDVVKRLKQDDGSLRFSGMLSMLPKETQLQMLGGEATPFAIMLYPKSFDLKEEMLDYLDKWNDEREFDEQVIYTDLAGTITGLTSNIMSTITVVLIAFAAISLFVSLIMIAIITYTSVLERTKEIGILKSLGARKKDITRVFDAETFIIGVFSGTLGVAIAYLLTVPINALIEDMTELPNVAQLNLLHVIALLILSTALTVLGGHIPARMASKKDAVEALRSE